MGKKKINHFDMEKNKQKNMYIKIKKKKEEDLLNK
jgi:hypothetical protein